MQQRLAVDDQRFKLPGGKQRVNDVANARTWRKRRKERLDLVLSRNDCLSEVKRNERTQGGWLTGG